MVDSIATNQSRWQNQKAQRLQLGDALEVSRPVDQNAYFRSAKSAALVTQELESHGFAVTSTRSLFRTHLSATRDESLKDESVDAFLRLVVPLIESNGGTYDGFGGPVVATAKDA